TLGRAGHASEILKRLNQNGFLYAIDQDKTAID
ncbi:16S rRNA (cytosine(1402)-N(4))-methyltransferase, partial [Mycoplasma capricolum]